MDLKHEEESVGETTNSEKKINGKMGREEAEHPKVTSGAEANAPAEDATTGSSSEPIGSPLSDAATGTSKPKGYGLKKWRRIRRDLDKESAAIADSAVILKRRLSIPERARSLDETKQRSNTEGDGSVASNTAVSLAAAVVTEASAGFPVGTDSDNSEDRSSKLSTTAASAPRMRHEAIGSGRQRSRGKGSIGRGLVHVTQQRNQRGRRGGSDASKKFRGEDLRLEKENSHSIIESEVRSSNSASTGCGGLASGNGKQRYRSVNDYMDHSNEARASKEIRSGHYKENYRVGDSLREDEDGDLPEEGNVWNSNNFRSSMDLDPFVESVVLLQAAQEALETEIWNFDQIGKGPIFDESNGHIEETEGSSSSAVGTNFTELIQKINHLEHNLEETSATVKVKESMVLEIEAILNKTCFQRKSNTSTDLLFLQENHKEIELEIQLDGLLQKRMEAEIEYLILARATQSWKVLLEDQASLFQEQKILLRDQGQVMPKLKDTENKAVTLKEQEEALETRCKELLEIEEVLRLQNKVYRSTLWCSIQLMMLGLAFWWFVMQLMPLSDAVVPT